MAETLNGWTERAWIAENPRASDYRDVIWDIPAVREALIADREAAGWTIHGPYELPEDKRMGGREGRLEAERLHLRAKRSAPHIPNDVEVEDG